VVDQSAEGDDVIGAEKSGSDVSYRVNERIRPSLFIIFTRKCNSPFKYSMI